jgi:hypothetical protein
MKSISVKLNSGDKLNDYKDAFIAANDRFEEYLNQVGVKGLESDVNKTYENIIKENDSEEVVNVLNKKTATYDLASQLIDAWTSENKEVTGPFKSISGITNPFVAITLFAIAQAGLNPIFYKAVGTKTGGTGTYTEFPAKSAVDSKTETEDMKVIDSPTKAGFQLSFTLTLNAHTYKTLLDFTFSSTVIKVEVVSLTAIK